MKKAVLFLAVSVLMLMISCGDDQPTKTNSDDNSKINVLSENLPTEVIKYYHIQDTDIIDNINAKILIIKDLNSFESLFGHNRMMDSATFYEFYLKSVKAEDFEDKYVVAVILPKSKNGLNIGIKDVYLQDSILNVTYQSVTGVTGFPGFSLTYINKCTYQSIVGNFIE